MCVSVCVCLRKCVRVCVRLYILRDLAGMFVWEDSFPSLALLSCLDLNLTQFNCRCYYTNLLYCQSITAAGFACLSSLMALEDLDVSCTMISNDGLRVIASLPAIHTLVLQGCGHVSAGAVASLSISNVFADNEDEDEY